MDRAFYGLPINELRNAVYMQFWKRLNIPFNTDKKLAGREVWNMVTWRLLMTIILFVICVYRVFFFLVFFFLSWVIINLIYHCLLHKFNFFGLRHKIIFFVPLSYFIFFVVWSNLCLSMFLQFYLYFRRILFLFLLIIFTF